MFILTSETANKQSHCRCPNGHDFICTFTVSINAESDWTLIHTLGEGGTQLLSCPVCSKTWPIAEPIIIHQPALERLCLFVPDRVSHRSLQYRAHLMDQLAQEVVTEKNLHFLKFDTIIGTAALEDWLNKTPRPSTTVEIRKAFADLVSIVPDTEQSSDADQSNGSAPIKDQSTDT